jgi:hypothetical protein
MANNTGFKGRRRLSTRLRSLRDGPVVAHLRLEKSQQTRRKSDVTWVSDFCQWIAIIRTE